MHEWLPFLNLLRIFQFRILQLKGYQHIQWINSFFCNSGTYRGFMWLVIIGSLSSMLFGFFLAQKRGRQLRVLMYHKVDPAHQDMLTVTAEQLEHHLAHLQKQGYNFISVRHLADLSSLVSKSILLTFDDAYVNNLEYAYPVLKKYGACATLFVPSDYVGQTSRWDIQTEPILSLEQLRKLDPKVFELGLHSHTHRHYGKLTPEQIEEDIRANIRFFQENNLPFVPAFAYPYGGRPKDKARRQQMQQTMAKLGVSFAFRIGNRLNTYPFTNPYEIQRIDIRGTDTLEIFARKVKWGKQF